MRAESLGAGAEITSKERAVILGARSIWEFDHRFSAPRNGFGGAENYYERNAAKRFLDGVAVPTLVIHALDDPWIPPQPYLGYDWRRNPSLIPLLPRAGRPCRLPRPRPPHPLARSLRHTLPRRALIRPVIRQFDPPTILTRHCEDAQRRSNPGQTHVRWPWIASLRSQ